MTADPAPGAGAAPAPGPVDLLRDEVREEVRLHEVVLDQALVALDRVVPATLTEFLER